MLTTDQKFIVSILGMGERNAKTYNELKSRHNLKMSRRVFCETIERLRHKGIAIGAIRSNIGGYYLIESESERAKAMKQYRSQILREKKVYDSLKSAAIGNNIQQMIKD